MGAMGRMDSEVRQLEPLGEVKLGLPRFFEKFALGMIAGGKYCKTIDEILDHLLNSLMIYYVVLEFRKAEQ